MKRAFLENLGIVLWLGAVLGLFLSALAVWGYFILNPHDPEFAKAIVPMAALLLLFYLLFGIGLSVVAIGVYSTVNVVLHLLKWPNLDSRKAMLLRGFFFTVCSVLLAIFALRNGRVIAGAITASAKASAEACFSGILLAVELAALTLVVCLMTRDKLARWKAKNARILLVIIAALPWGFMVNFGKHAHEPFAHERLAEAGLNPPSATDAQAKVLVIGLDGASFDVIDPLLDQGKLPNFQKLISGGTRARLKTVVPTLSPAIWTTLATGKNRFEHGVRDFTKWSIPFNYFEKAKGIGVGQVKHLSSSAGIIEKHLISSNDRTCLAIWNILSTHSHTVGAINWWATWPAEPVNGFIVSDRISYAYSQYRFGINMPEIALAYPAELTPKILPLICHPNDVSASDYIRYMNIPEEKIEGLITNPPNRLLREFRYVYSADASVMNISRYCLSHFDQPDFLALYMRGIDHMCHCAMKYSQNAPSPNARPEDVQRYGETVIKYYQQTDRYLGELLALVSPATHVIVVSDHGWEREPNGEYSHIYAPDGIFIARGPYIRQGATLSNASVYDVIPTVLYIFGLPMAHDMEGVPLTEMFTQEFMKKPVPKPVSTYESGAKKASGLSTSVLDDEIIQRLKGVGYLN